MHQCWASCNFHRIFHAYNRVSNAYTRFSTHIQTFRTHTRLPHILSQALTSHTGKTRIHTNNIYHKRTHIHQTRWILWLPHQVPPSLTLPSSHLILPTKYHPHWVPAKSHQRFSLNGRKMRNIALPRTGQTHRTESQLLSHQSLHRSRFPPKVVLHIRPSHRHSWITSRKALQVLCSMTGFVPVSFWLSWGETKIPCRHTSSISQLRIDTWNSTESTGAAYFSIPTLKNGQSDISLSTSTEFSSSTLPSTTSTPTITRRSSTRSKVATHKQWNGLPPLWVKPPPRSSWLSPHSSSFREQHFSPCLLSPVFSCKASIDMQPNFLHLHCGE